MSLVYWFPLRGNLNNYGTGEGILTNYNAVIDSAGKIGQCYYFNSSSRMYSDMFTPSSDNVSLAFWLKMPIDVTSSGYICGLSRASSPVFMLYNYGATQLRLYIDGSNRKSYTHGLAANEWHHVAITYNGTIAKFYIDGIYKTYVNYAATTITTEDLRLFIGCRSNNANTNGNGTGFRSNYLNDIRYYNHCLSAAEVKEIAQGLILHYKLDSPYVETTTNLLSVAQSYKNESTLTITHTTSTNKYINVGNITTTAGNNIVTYSAYIINTSNSSIYPRIRGLGADGSTWRSFVSGSTIAAGESGWVAVTLDMTNTESYNGTNVYLRWQFNTARNEITENPTIQYAQLETHDHRTIWTLGGTTREGVVEDSSGYNNNGTTYGDLIIDTNTPRYENSVKFNGTDAAIRTTNNDWCVQGTRAMTISLWAKSSSWTGAHLFSCAQTGGFNTESGSSGYLRFPVRVYTDEEQTTTAWKYDSKEIKISNLSTTNWNMLTFVYDETGTRTYINGELHHTYTNQSYGIYFNLSARLFLGCEADAANPYTPYFNGQISDFRVYCTPLLDNDIKSLYNISMKVDNFGSVHAFEFDESIEENTAVSEYEEKASYTYSDDFTTATKTETVTQTYNTANENKGPMYTTQQTVSFNIYTQYANNTVNLLPSNSYKIHWPSQGVISNISKYTYKRWVQSNVALDGEEFFIYNGRSYVARSASGTKYQTSLQLALELFDFQDNILETIILNSQSNQANSSGLSVSEGEYTIDNLANYPTVEYGRLKIVYSGGPPQNTILSETYDGIFTISELARPPYTGFKVTRHGIAITQSLNEPSFTSAAKIKRNGTIITNNAIER